MLTIVFVMATVVPNKSDSGVIFCLQLYSKTLTLNLYTPLALTRIDISRVYNPADRINTLVI